MEIIKELSSEAWFLVPGLAWAVYNYLASELLHGSEWLKKAGSRIKSLKK